MNVSFKIRGVEALQEFLKKLPYGGVRIALKAFTEYVIGDERHGLKHNDPYKYVSRKRAYGQTFQSDKQRRYVMAKIRSGAITPGKPNRTGNTADGWQYQMINDWNYSVNNPEPGAYWIRDDKGQARQPALVGWRKARTVVMDNFKGGVRAAEAAIGKWIKGNG